MASVESASIMSTIESVATFAKGQTGRCPIQLYLTCNDDYLSQYQCLVRKQIEFFEAGPLDVQTNIQGRNRPVVLGQVGIQCRHCASIPLRERAVGAVYYPSKVNGIYQLCQNMAVSHFMGNCTMIPEKMRNDLFRLREEHFAPKKKSPIGNGKEMWEKTAESLGVYNDLEDNVMRFDPCWAEKATGQSWHLTVTDGSKLPTSILVSVFDDEENDGETDMDDITFTS